MKAVKDSHTGAGGIGYSIIFTALSIVALGELSPQLVFFGPFVAELLNKNAMVFAASAGSSREGLGGIFVKNTSGKTAAISALISWRSSSLSDFVSIGTIASRIYWLIS